MVLVSCLFCLIFAVKLLKTSDIFRLIFSLSKDIKGSLVSNDTLKGISACSIFFLNVTAFFYISFS
ncbi:putative membrane protein [Rickettsia amblyommatis str. Ac/Pa]|uniref:Putative membrane protein n=1 Tax=Rickettsia amblyommatis str. Ac/Pa TaxID=1359164 RepID=A0A0F3N167_RICAM|nr:putative membrane protein [Rickettsia amblyommatis str. Ac/Pa]